jgi:hypothetical protein
MSTLSHNRGQERTHDPDQTHRKPCAHKGTKKRKLTQDHLHKILTRFELWPGWKPWSFNRFLSLNNWVMTHCRSQPDVTPKSEVQWRKEPTITYYKMWHNLSQTPKMCPHSSLPIKVKKQDTQRSTSSHPQEIKTPQHCHCFVRKANDHIISPKSFSISTLNWANTPFRNPEWWFQHNFNQAIHKWPLWTFFFQNITWIICRAYSTHSATMD